MDGEGFGHTGLYHRTSALDPHPNAKLRTAQKKVPIAGPILQHCVRIDILMCAVRRHTEVCLPAAQVAEGGPCTKSRLQEIAGEGR